MKRKENILAVLLLSAIVMAPAVAVADATDRMLEDLLGPADEVIASLAISAGVGNAETRAEAIWKLARLDHEKCVKPLAGLVEDAPPDVRPFVAMGLGWLGNKAGKSAPNLAQY